MARQNNLSTRLRHSDPHIRDQRQYRAVKTRFKSVKLTVIDAPGIRSVRWGQGQPIPTVHPQLATEFRVGAVAAAVA